MVAERKFIKEKVKRMLVKEFIMKEIEGAGFGGLDIQRTPMGTRLSMLVERPGLVIGRGGANINKLSKELVEKFQLDNPQIEIQEVGNNAALNAQIMAEKLAEALERGWHFRRAGHATVKRIMDAGAKGCQVIISGKLTGERHRTEKFTEGHIKYCGEIVKEVMDEGYAIAKLKPGILGVKVRIMKPDAKLPDEIHIKTVEETKTEEKKEEKQPVGTKLSKIKELDSSLVKKLEKAGIETIEELYDMSIEEIASIEGLNDKIAKTLKEKLEKIIKEVK
ncbi:MAG: 30S ribosomal protein S3 [Thermoplasmata archaeon]|nr:30S ribosomal protein S3 [Thermoplasmata archaeon]RLF30682.1 MAG: 30S ribosomal protein S3 [Thermoplasmata archaeon]